MAVAFHQSENSESLCGGAAFARPDYDRAMRQGAGEVIYGEGKTRRADRRHRLVAHGRPVNRAFWRPAWTRRRPMPWPLYGATTAGSPRAPTTRRRGRRVRRHARARRDGVGGHRLLPGTSDLPWPRRRRLTAEFLGNEVRRFYDVGVAGIHRLLDVADELRAARVVVAVAGMEGALASVVGGLISAPVIAVPTSVGYGASFGGVTALLAMLNSCASGVSVVNIDNGFGAAFQASAINHLNSRQG